MLQYLLRLASLGLTLSIASACSHPSPRDSSSSPTASAAAGAPSGGASERDRPREAEATQIEVDDALRKRGYKPEVYRGARVYCRSEILTGSNLASKVCLTPRQIEDLERSGQDMLNGTRPAGCMPKTSGPTCM